MREIRFRYWHKQLHDMIYWNVASGGRLFWDVIMDYPEMYSLMQYTGLKDKNGVEIYEGDIVKALRTPDNFHDNALLYRPKYYEFREVKFHITDGGISLILEKDGTYAERHPENHVYWEVVGNIYETPELLK